MATESTKTFDSDGVDLKQIVEDGYNKIAPAYLEWATTTPTSRVESIQKLITLLPVSKDTAVLELGCGAGVPATQLLAKHFNVTGNDISAAQIELAKQHVPEATLIHGDMMSLEFQPGSFDAIIALYSVIHLPREEQSVMIDRIVEWVKEGGYILVNFGGEENPGTFQEGWLGGNNMFWSAFDNETSQNIVKEAGFELVEAVIRQDLKDAPFLWILAKKRTKVKASESS